MEQGDFHHRAFHAEWRDANLPEHSERDSFCKGDYPGEGDRRMV